MNIKAFMALAVVALTAACGDAPADVDAQAEIAANEAAAERSAPPANGKNPR
jgi:hypothetical protein